MTAKLHRITEPTEMQEAIALADWLRSRGHVFLHVPNEGRRTVRQGALLKRVGLQPGASDVVVFTRTQQSPHGAMLELKRRSGGRASQAQLAWIDTMTALGWQCTIAHGALEAVSWLKGIGY